ncbi:MAG: hypothetical protein QM497_09295 [Sulfurimonas sp.]
MRIFLLWLLLLLGTSLLSNEHSFRKYNHVKNFYAAIAKDTIKICKEHNLPSAAVLAIAGLESGYGSGYVAQITGNILSLGAFKSDKELPALYLPYSSSKQKILFDPNIINKLPKSDLSYKKRAKSYKRDYRPLKYAGTKTNLELLKYNKELRLKAHRACLNDFSTRWIHYKSNKKVFKELKIWTDKQVKTKSIDTLYSRDTNLGFIDRIGGVPHSFNYRKTWPKKVKLIMKKVGLVELVNDIDKNNMSFKESWERKN